MSSALRPTRIAMCTVRHALSRGPLKTFISIFSGRPSSAVAASTVTTYTMNSSSMGSRARAHTQPPPGYGIRSPLTAWHHVLLRHEPRIDIAIITHRRPGSLKRLLRSLTCARYFGDRVDVAFSLELGADEETATLARSWEWAHGEVRRSPLLHLPSGLRTSDCPRARVGRCAASRASPRAVSSQRSSRAGCPPTRTLTASYSRTT